MIDRQVLLSALASSALTASLVVAGPAAAREVGSRIGISTATSTTTIPIQVRLASSGGTPTNGLKAMTFKLYNVSSGGSVLWSETWSAGNAVRVTDGVASVLLGSQTPLSQSIVANNSTLHLGITIDTEAEMQPRVQLGSAPIAMTVPDGSITAAKLADDVSFVPPAASITTIMLADDSVTPDKIQNRLRTVWVPAATFQPVSDTPIYSAIGNWSANGYFLSHGGGDGVVSTVGIPSDKLANTAMTVTFHYASADTSGNFRVRHGWKLLNTPTGGSLANPETAVEHTTPISAISWQIVSIDEVVPSSLVAPDNAIGVYLHRLGAEATDTLAQDLVFVGLSIAYQADN